MVLSYLVSAELPVAEQPTKRRPDCDCCNAALDLLLFKKDYKSIHIVSYTKKHSIDKTAYKSRSSFHFKSAHVWHYVESVWFVRVCGVLLCATTYEISTFRPPFPPPLVHGLRHRPRVGSSPNPDWSGCSCILAIGIDPGTSLGGKQCWAWPRT